VAAAQDARWTEDYDDDDDEHADEEDHADEGGGGGEAGADGGGGSTLPVGDAPKHGGRSEAWWSVWHALHRDPQPDAASDQLKDFLKEPAGLAEAAATSELPRATCGLTLLHQAARTGNPRCAAALLRSGAFPGDPSVWLFDLRGRSPRECALRFQRSGALAAVDDHAHEHASKQRKLAKQQQQQQEQGPQQGPQLSAPVRAGQARPAPRAAAGEGPWTYGPSVRSAEW
jgi:hypothetical protein